MDTDREDRWVGASNWLGELYGIGIQCWTWLIKFTGWFTTEMSGRLTLLMSRPDLAPHHPHVEGGLCLYLGQVCVDVDVFSDILVL
jgi:hypothetical protein